MRQQLPENQSEQGNEDDENVYDDAYWGQFKIRQNNLRMRLGLPLQPIPARASIPAVAPIADDNEDF